MNESRKAPDSWNEKQIEKSLKFGRSATILETKNSKIFRRSRVNGCWLSWGRKWEGLFIVVNWEKVARYTQNYISWIIFSKVQNTDFLRECVPLQDGGYGCVGVIGILVILPLRWKMRKIKCCKQHENEHNVGWKDLESRLQQYLGNFLGGVQVSVSCTGT